MAGQGDRHRGDDADEERDRYRELLAELRTIIPGAQVLLAFLLTVPFASRFEQVDQLGKVVFTVSLMAIAAAVVLFLAPAAYHRLAPRSDRLGRLRFGVRVALVGMALVGLSIASAVFVVVRFLFDSTTTALVLAAATAVLATLSWLVVPLLRGRADSSPREVQDRP